MGIVFGMSYRPLFGVGYIYSIVKLRRIESVGKRGVEEPSPQSRKEKRIRTRVILVTWRRIRKG